MKNEKYIKSLNMIEPENAARERMLKTALTRAKSGTVSKLTTVSRTVRWLAPVTVCLLIVAVVAVPTISKLMSAKSGGGISFGNVSPGNWTPDGSFLNLDECKGLPAGDFTWDEGEGISASRLWIGELRHLFNSFENAHARTVAPVHSAIAIVKVKAVQPFTEPDGYWSGEGQIAFCEVVYDNILENSRQLPEFPQIKQYLYGGCAGVEETNLLRVGGVYVLPLTLHQSEYWSIWSDLDVLFEVDNNGLLHSHSRQEGFSKYDGKELALLWNDLIYLDQHPILYSQFSENIFHDGYTEIIDGVLRMRWKNSEWNNEDIQGFSAKIIDGLITVETKDFNVFRPFEGRTVDEMNTAVAEIKQYLGID